MKRCPVCQTMLFKDMSTCYGCLYKFPEGDDPIGEGAIDARREKMALEVRVPSIGIPPLKGKEAAPAPPDKAHEPAVSCSEEVETLPEEGWILRVEMRDPELPARSWMISLGSPPKLAAA